MSEEQTFHEILDAMDATMLERLEHLRAARAQLEDLTRRLEAVKPQTDKKE